MDKIKSMLVKAGISTDAADSICQALLEHKTQVESSVRSEYDQKIDRIKALCLEETEAHKRELSRRLQIFLEAKHNLVQERIVAQARERGTVAQSRLEKISAIVEGVEPQVVPAQFEEEREKLVSESKSLEARLKEQSEVAVKFQTLATKAVRRARILESKAVEYKKMLAESKAAQPIVRKKGQSTTSTPMLVESRKPKPQPRPSQPSGSVTPDQIADMIGE